MAIDWETRQEIRGILKRLDEYLNRHTHVGYHVVFDIGTKAVKVLVGTDRSRYKNVPWIMYLNSIFSDVVLETRLGNALAKDENKIIVSDEFIITLDFIEQIKSKLQSASIKSVMVVGTEVFRQMSERTQKEVFDKIQDSTGLPLRIISAKEEAEYSLLALQHTFEKEWSSNLFGAELRERDLFLLCEQGAGSTQVASYYPMGNQSKVLHPIKPLNNRNLEAIFWTAVAKNKSGRNKPASIEEAIQIVRTYIRSQLADDPILEQLKKTPHQRIYIFGMGTALKVCFDKHHNQQPAPVKRGKHLHMASLSIKNIRDVYKSVQIKLSKKHKTIDVLEKHYRHVSRVDRGLRRDSELLYTLPTFELLLELLEADSISYAYFNMRYGVLISCVAERIN